MRKYARILNYLEKNTVLLNRATQFLCLIASDGATCDSDWSWKETPGAQRPIKDLRESHYAVEGIKQLKVESCEMLSV